MDTRGYLLSIKRRLNEARSRETPTKNDIERRRRNPPLRQSGKRNTFISGRKRQSWRHYVDMSATKEQLALRLSIRPFFFVHSLRLPPSFSFPPVRETGRNRTDLESGSRDRVTRSQIQRDRSCHAVSRTAPRALTRIYLFFSFSFHPISPLLTSKSRLTTYRPLKRRRSHRGDGRVGYQERGETGDIAGGPWKKREIGPRPPRAANFTRRSINPNGTEYYADGRGSARDFTAKRLAVPVAVYVYVTRYAETRERDEPRRDQERYDWSWMIITPRGPREERIKMSGMAEREYASACSNHDRPTMNVSECLGVESPYNYI